MELILTGVTLVVLIVAANLVEARRQTSGQHWFHWLLLALNLVVLAGGLMLATQPPAGASEGLDGLDQAAIDVAGTGRILVVLALWGALTSLYQVRRLIARVTNVDPSSAVHSLALMLSGYLVGETVAALSQGGLEGLLDNMEPQSISVLILGELLFAGTGLLGVGILVRRNGSELLRRLGLERPKASYVLTGIGWIALMVVIQTIGGAAWALANPDQAETLSDVNNLLLGEIDTVWEWLLLAIATGVGEEILFRGALQPVFGLFATSALFAVVHFQYGFTPFLLIVVFLALIFGYLRRRYNTTYVILVHAGYNFFLGLMALLAVSLT